MAAMVDYLMLGTGRSLKDLPEFDPSMLLGELESTPTLKSAPPFLKDALIFPYISGLNFSAAVLKSNGWPALSEIGRASCRERVWVSVARASRLERARRTCNTSGPADRATRL